jgi:hypothetical protein
VPGPYDYLGGQELWYQDYLDDATGHMLIAQPETAYSMSAVNGALAVPPPDGRWAVPAPPEPPPPPVVIQPAPAPEPAPEGGD